MHYFNTRLKESSIDLNNDKISNLQRAAIYFCINRQSFRAWGLARPPSKCEEIKPLSYFTRWKTWNNNYIKVLCSDYQPIIENANGTFMYLDPPYVGKEFFYGEYRPKSEGNFDHEHLSDLLHHTDSKWIMSYGNHELIKELYKDYTILEPQWKYATRPNSDTVSDELLILNI